MRTLTSILFIIISMPFFSQTREELTKAMLSNNQTEIFDFIQKYPNNPNVPFLKKRMEMVKGNGASVAKPTVEPLNKERLEKQIESLKEKNEQTAKAKRTENVLNHLFDNDPNKKEAYVLIRNKSNCNLVVKLEGYKKYYNLDVPKMGENYILVPKGNYKITTMICSAQYSSVKNITEDMQIDLNGKRVKN